MWAQYRSGSFCTVSRFSRKYNLSYERAYLCSGCGTDCLNSSAAAGRKHRSSSAEVRNKSHRAQIDSREARNCINNTLQSIVQPVHNWHISHTDEPGKKENILRLLFYTILTYRELCSIVHSSYVMSNRDYRDVGASAANLLCMFSTGVALLSDNKRKSLKTDLVWDCTIVFSWKFDQLQSSRSICIHGNGGRSDTSRYSILQKVASQNNISDLTLCEAWK